MTTTHQLPDFACISERGDVDLWPTEPELSYGDACSVGRDRGQHLVEVIRRTQSSATLGHVLETIVNKGSMTGLEIGFAHALSEELQNTRTIREFVQDARPVETPSNLLEGGKRHLRVVKSVAA